MPFIPDNPNTLGATPGFIPDPVQPAQVPQKSIFNRQNVAGALDTVFGSGKLGEAIGTQIARFNASPSERQFIDSGPNAKQVLGSVARSAALFIPEGKIVQGLGVGAEALGAGSKLASFAGRVGAGAATGYGLDVASGLENNENTKDVLKPGVGTLAGGGLPIVGSAVLGPIKSKISKTAATNVESRLLEKTKELKQLTTSLEKNTKFINIGGKRIERSNPIKTISSLGIAPEVIDGKINTDKIRVALDQAFQEAKSVQNDLISNVEKKVPFKSFANTIREQVKKDATLADLGKTDSVLNQANTILKSYRTQHGNSIPVKSIDRIRQSMNRVWKDDPAFKDVYRVIGDAAREIVYNAAPDQAIKNILLKESDLISASDFALNLAGKAVQGGKLAQMLGYMSGSTAGAIAGSAFGPVGSVVGSGVGAVVGNKVRSLAQRSYFNPLSGPVARFGRKLMPDVSEPLKSAARKEVSSFAARRKGRDQ